MLRSFGHTKNNPQIKKLQNTLINIEKNISNNETNYFNTRIRNNKELWKPRVSPILESYKKMIERKNENPNSDLIYRSRYDKINPFDKGYITVFNKNYSQRVVPSDFIMFNKNYDLEFNELERLLSYSKIMKNKNLYVSDYKLDGWSYYNPNYTYLGATEPNYTIDFSMRDYESMSLLQTETDKLLAVRAMIQIMNECDINDINMRNYHVMAEWETINHRFLNSYEDNLYALRISKQILNEEIKLSHFDTKLLEYLSKKEIIDILYRHASGGFLDSYSIYGKYKKIDYDSINTNDKIDKINDCNINVSLNHFNLEEYAKENNIQRANNVIEDIKREVEYRININMYKNKDGSDITKGQLIVILYNYLMPEMKGMIESPKIMYSGITLINDITQLIKFTPEHAETISSSDFLHCLFRLSFNMFPIIDYKYFDKEHGYNKFNNILEKYFIKQ